MLVQNSASLGNLVSKIRARKKYICMGNMLSLFSHAQIVKLSFSAYLWDLSVAKWQIYVLTRSSCKRRRRIIIFYLFFLSKIAQKLS